MKLRFKRLSLINAEICTNMGLFLVATIFFLFITFVNCFDEEILDFNIRMKQNLHNEGFHRNITYGIVFNAKTSQERWIYKGCVVALEQELPPGIYANPDELWDLGRMHRLDAVPRNRVNIEMPAEQSYPTSIYIKGKIRDGKAYLWLPVHARYHAAVSGGGFATNTIPSPKLFVRCEGSGGAGGRGLGAALCNGSSKENCRWQELPYTLMTQPIKWEVPVGDLYDYYLVSIGTATAIIIGSVYLLRALHQYNVVIKKKTQ